MASTCELCSIDLGVERYCLATSGGNRCTMKAGHKGDHAECIGGAHPHDTWPNEPPASTVEITADHVTIRQRYKMAVANGNAYENVDSRDFARWISAVADAMIADDKKHEDEQ